MDPRRVASIAGLLGGLAWLAQAALTLVDVGDRSTDPVRMVFLGGLALLFLGLAAAGYTLVETAPVWLRLVVAIATPLLVLMVWQLVDQAVEEEISALAGGGVAVVVALWGLGRHRPDDGDDPPPPPPVRGRRAAR